jgi:hypothetical protein
VGGRSKEFWVLSLPVLPGYRSGALANLREEAPSHTASLGRVAPPSPSGSHYLRGKIIDRKQCAPIHHDRDIPENWMMVSSR